MPPPGVARMKPPTTSSDAQRPLQPAGPAQVADAGLEALDAAADEERADAGEQR